MPKNSMSEKTSPEIISMFRQSIAPYSKKLVALHPHLYGSLYRRASEIQALDKILKHLDGAKEEAKIHRYESLPPILESIKDALHGQPPLSWWNLFTTSVGYAFGASTDQSKNAQEKEYLSNISQILTDIIRNYHSSNTKLLLNIRLTAMEVDARLVEIERIPEGVVEVNDTLEYLTSEFELLTREIDKILKLPAADRVQNQQTLIHFIDKVNKLLAITANVEQTDLLTYNKFIQGGHLEALRKSVKLLIKEFSSEEYEIPPNPWEAEEIDCLFDFFMAWDDAIIDFSPTKICSLLLQSDNLFLANPDLGKIRPPIFFSPLIKKYIEHWNVLNKETFEFLRAFVKGEKSDATIVKDPLTHYKGYLMIENDLHQICTFAQIQPREALSKFQDPAQIQREILNRLIILSNLSRPKDLDTILKSFSDEEKDHRYFLIQEVILEQFIRWRKQGIY